MLDDMNKRIIELMVYSGHSKSTFARVLDASLPLITHITTGRNKPGLELIQKILHAFPHLNARWLLLGEGPMEESKQVLPDFSDIKAELAAQREYILSQQTDIESVKQYNRILLDEILHVQDLQVTLENVQYAIRKSAQELDAIQSRIESKLSI